MNRALVLSGLALLVTSAAMGVLLLQLGEETFRADLVSWEWFSYGAAAVGAGLAITGVVLRESLAKRVGISTSIRSFVYAALANTVAAGLFVLPIFIPEFEFPILITTWPGTYMVVAYVAFVLVGVLGNAAWATILSASRDVAEGTSLSRRLLVAQLLLTEIGILGAAVFMFLGGFVGATLNHGGGGDVTVGIAMEFAVIPAAVSIFMVVAGELLGVANTVSSMLKPVPPSS